MALGILQALDSDESVDNPDRVYRDIHDIADQLESIARSIREDAYRRNGVLAKLRGARERRKRLTGAKVEGRKSHAEERPDVVALARTLARKKPKGGQLSLRAISAELEARGYNFAE